jgi:prepilin-type N-terminal cleavage/methylation domain-containing protein
MPEAWTAAARRGFTLIELLVVFGIIVTIMGVVFTNQGSFNKTLVLSTTAYDVALTMRNAATFGLGSRAAGSTANVGYGLHFDKTTPATFVLFADTSPAASCATPDCKPGDGTYTSGSDTLVRTYALGNGITITDFCAYVSGWSCTSLRGGAGNDLTVLDVEFARPNPNPSITVHRGSASVYTATAACIVISSSLGTNRYIAVSTVGQISVNSISCP